MLKHSARDAALAAVGCGLVLAALALVWGARATIPRPVYVSELGASGMPTATAFLLALLALVGGGALIAWAARGVVAEVRVLRAWTPAASLGAAGGLLLIAAQVPCTSGCPAPFTPGSTWQDALHTTAAVLAFGAVCWAMLQCAFARRHPAIAVLSGGCAWGVGATAGLGGLLSLADVALELGAWCEFLAMTLAIGWVVLLGAAVAIGHAKAAGGIPAALAED